MLDGIDALVAGPAFALTGETKLMFPVDIVVPWQTHWQLQWRWRTRGEMRVGDVCACAK
jgi:hypothetical protein